MTKYKLGDVFKTTSGGTPSRKVPEYYKGHIPWVKSGELESNVIVDTEERISEEAIINSSAKVFPKGTLLIALYGATIGKLARLGIDAATNQAVCGIFENEEHELDYLYWFLFHKRRDLIKAGIGGAQPNISQTILKSLEIPLPPKETQQQIVSKIEELFSELDKGIEELKTAQQQLEVFRKTILMNGATGKLTENWREENPNTKNSETIFQELQSFLDKAFKEASEKAVAEGKRKPRDQRKNKKTFKDESHLPALPENWKYYRLEDITYLVTDGTHFTPKYQDTGVKFLSVKNVRPFYFREEHVKYISREEHGLLVERCNPQKNDILYTKVGATYGYAAKVTMDYQFSIFVSLCLIKPVHEYLLSSFLEILLNSELVFQQARSRVSGSGVPDLHLIEIRDFKIPLPPVEEQQQIVQEIESRLSVCDKIQETITNSLKQAEALRQSILKKAFEGKLC